MKFNVLVLEGGGAKGPYEMGVLEVLEMKTGKCISEFIDLVVATSVGSVIGSLICTGMRPMHEWSEIVLKEMPSFFKKRGLFCLPLYDKKNYIKLYEKYCRPGLLMAELPVKFMVTSVDRCEPRTHFFKSWEDKDGQLPVTEAVVRSFSAPYYFGATIDEQNSKVWLDGGMGIDNLPLFEAYIETLLQGWLKPGNSVHILAVGSGRADEYVPFDIAKKSNLISQTVDQIKTYANITEGGLAREMSTLEQVRNLKAIVKATPNLTFQWIDWLGMPKEIDKMDAVEYRNRYYQRGLTDGKMIDESLFRKE